MPISTLELMDVRARLYPAGIRMSEERLRDIATSHWWYCSGGSDVSDGTVIERFREPEEDAVGVALEDITLFDIDYPASVAYAKEVWDDFTFVAYDSEYILDYDEQVRADLAAIARALLLKQKCKPFLLSVRFLAAFEVVTTEAGWVGLEYWQEAESEATLIGWASIDAGGMTIIPVDQLREEAQKPLP